MSKDILAKPPHRIRVWQEDNGHSDEKVAELFGVHPRTVDRWCEGTNSPTIEQAQIVADVTAGFVGLLNWRTGFTDRRRKAARSALKSKASRAPKQEALPKKRKTEPTTETARVGKITKGK